VDFLVLKQTVEHKALIKSCQRTRMVSRSQLGPGKGYPEFCRAIPQSLQTDVRILPQTDYDRFLPNPCNYPINLLIDDKQPPIIMEKLNYPLQEKFTGFHFIDGKCLRTRLSGTEESSSLYHHHNHHHHSSRVSP